MLHSVRVQFGSLSLASHTVKWTLTTTSLFIILLRSVILVSNFFNDNTNLRAISVENS